MKKAIYLLVLLFIGITLVGCKVNSNKVNSTEIYDYLIKTKNEYSTSSKGHITLTIEDSESTQVTEFAFIYNENVIEYMKLEQTDGDEKTSTYVKDNKVYQNFNGNKTFATLESTEGQEIIEELWFEDITENVFKTLNKGIFNASVVESDKNGVAKLVWNIDNYIFIDEDFTDAEYLEADQLYFQIYANMKAIEINVNHDQELVKSLDSIWTNNNNEVSKIKIEFHTTSSVNPTYPTDLDSYIPR